MSMPSLEPEEAPVDPGELLAPAGALDEAISAAGFSHGKGGGRARTHLEELGLRRPRMVGP